MASDDHIPGAAPLVSEQLARWRVTLALRHVVAAEVGAAGLIWLLPWSSWWVPVLVAAAALVMATLTYHGATAAGWAARWLRFVVCRRSAGAQARRAALPQPFGVESAGAGPVGMVWDGQYAITMIALHGHAYAPTFLDPSGAQTEDTAPLAVVAGLLRQFGGLQLASVDVVSAGQRTAAARFAATYDEIIGDRPAVGLRHTWLVLRLCPQACLAAMAYRGDAAAAAAAATERIRQAVARSGCRAVTCTAEQMTAATDVLLGGVDLAEVAESWSHVDAGAEYITSYRVAGRELSTDWVNDVWSVRSELTVLTARLTRGAGGAVTVAGLVRFHTRTQLTHPPVLACRPVSGRAFAALAASLPLGNRSLELPMSARRLDAAPLDIAVTPAGFMIGTTTATGLPVLLALADPLKVTRVHLGVELAVAQQFVLRATATGATVLVHTHRPHLWEPICDDHIWLTEPGPGQGSVTMVVIDGDDNATSAVSVGERGHTVAALSAAPAGDSDVSLAQISAGELRLTTPRVANVGLMILRPRNEALFLAHLRTGRPEPAAALR